MQPSDSRFRRVSAILAVLTLCAMLATAAVICVAPFVQDDLSSVLLQSLDLAPDLPMTPARLWAGYALGAVPLIALVWTLNQMRALFRHFASGDMLTDTAARLIRRTGQGFLIVAALPLLLQPFQTVVLSWGAPDGERVVSLGVSSDMVGFALVSGLLIVIGWAMAHAARQAAENSAFV